MRWKKNEMKYTFYWILRTRVLTVLLEQLSVHESVIYVSRGLCWWLRVCEREWSSVCESVFRCMVRTSGRTLFNMIDILRHWHYVVPALTTSWSNFDSGLNCVARTISWTGTEWQRWTRQALCTCSRFCGRHAKTHPSVVLARPAVYHCTGRQ